MTKRGDAASCHSRRHQPDNQQLAVETGARGAALKCTLVRHVRALGFINELRRDRSRAGCVFGDRYTNLKFAIGVVELETAQTGLAASVGNVQIGSQAIGEETGRAFVGETEAGNRAGDGRPRLIGNLDQ